MELSNSRWKFSNQLILTKAKTNNLVGVPKISVLNRGNRVNIQRKNRVKSRTVLIETVLTEESLYCEKCVGILGNQLNSVFKRL